MSRRYRVEFEVVSALGDGRRFYTGSDPNTTPDKVPDEFWHAAARESESETSILDQARVLKAWAVSGEQLIRNVRVFQWDAPKVEPQWQEVTI